MATDPLPTTTGPAEQPRAHDELASVLPSLRPAALAATINLLGFYPDLDQVRAVLERRSSQSPRAGARGVVAQLVYAAQHELWRDQRQLAELAGASKGAVGRVFGLLRADGFLLSEEGGQHSYPRHIEAPCQRHRLRWTADTVDLAGPHLALRARAYAWLTTAADVAPDDAREIARRRGPSGLVETWAIHRHRQLTGAKTGHTNRVTGTPAANTKPAPSCTTLFSNRGELRGVPASLRESVPPDSRSGLSKAVGEAGGALARPRRAPRRPTLTTASTGGGADHALLFLRLMDLAGAVKDNAPRSTARQVLNWADEHRVPLLRAVQLYDDTVAGVVGDRRDGLVIRNPAALAMHRWRHDLVEGLEATRTVSPDLESSPQRRRADGEDVAAVSVADLMAEFAAQLTPPSLRATHTPQPRPPFHPPAPSLVSENADAQHQLHAAADGHSPLTGPTSTSKLTPSAAPPSDTFLTRLGAGGWPGGPAASSVEQVEREYLALPEQLRGEIEAQLGPTAHPRLRQRRDSVLWRSLIIAEARRRQ